MYVVFFCFNESDFIQEFFVIGHASMKGFPGGTSGKESACQCRRCKKRQFNFWAGKIPWSRKWQPTPVFLPGKSLGQKSLAGYHPGGCKELDMTEQLILTSQHVTKKIWWDWFICLVPKSDVNYQSIGQFEGATDDKEKGMAIHSSILTCRIP